MAALNTTKKLYGLIGYPLAHSFSMDYFNQKFKAEHIDAEYLNFEIEDIGQLMEVISEYPNLDGLNVTAPYKEQVIPYLDSIDDGARNIGAVNVIKFIRNDRENELKLRGYNSDVIGFGKSIEPYIDAKHRQAMVLGSGGASKAVSYALNKFGVEVMHVSRKKSASTVTYEELTKAMVHEHPYRFLTKEHLCYDLIYNPDETLFMKQSKEHGAEVKNGLEMLLLQGFAAYEIWTK